MAARDDDWRAAHDPSTTSAELERIARSYPEFADAAAAHPNASPSLRAAALRGRAGAASASVPPVARPSIARSASVQSAWSKHEGGSPDAGTPDASAPGARVQAAAPRGRRKLAVGISILAASVLLLGGAAWAGVAVLGPNAAPGAAASSGPGADGAQALSGDPLPAAEPMGAGVFTGEDLDLLVPSETELAEVFPGAAEVESSRFWGTMGESEGYIGDPEACRPLVFLGYTQVVGYRLLRWKDAAADSGRFQPWAGTISVTQMPTEQQANDIFDAFHTASESCSSYAFRPGETKNSAYAKLFDGDAAHTRSVAGEITVTPNEYRRDEVHVVVQQGNVVIEARVAKTLADAASAEQLRDLLAERFAVAREAVADELGRPLD